MIVLEAAGQRWSPEKIELCLTGLSLLLALGWPRLGGRLFRRIEGKLGELALHRRWSVAAVGLSSLFLRLALLPLIPIPKPFIQDDFSFLLAADTFALGRLSNPTPALWTHFESFHICMTPTYMSMYFPAQGLVLAAAKVLTGNAWFGVLAATALMCASFCWMLQAWLPARWALFGGMLAVLHLGLFSYWINSFAGAGPIAALGGALILGALPRIVRARGRIRWQIPILLAAGIVLVALSRPYEGVLLLLPVGVVLVRWGLRSSGKPPVADLVRLSAFPVLMVMAAVGWLGYYDNQVNGNALTLPYSINRATYAVAPYWIWQAPRPEPVYRHQVMRDFYVKRELPIVLDIQTPHGFFVQELCYKPLMVVWFLAGTALIPLVFWLPWALRDRRIRFFVICFCLWIPGMLIQIFLLPHYIAVFLPALYCVGLQAMRHLRASGSRRHRTGVALARFLTVTVLVMVSLRAFAGPLHLRLNQAATSQWAFDWYGPDDFGERRAKIERFLESQPGNQLVLVRYSAGHISEDEWVYNGPEIENSKVIWAREMNPSADADLLRVYGGRTVWLVEPDAEPARITAYPGIQAGGKTSAMPRRTP
jgi:hypothetical protein